MRGGRPSRTTASGYWKATGSPSHVYSTENKVIGMKKSMVFYKGKAPTGRKTKWKMNEYRAIKEDLNTSMPMVCGLQFSTHFVITTRFFLNFNLDYSIQNIIKFMTIYYIFAVEARNVFVSSLYRIGEPSSVRSTPNSSRRGRGDLLRARDVK